MIKLSVSPNSLTSKDVADLHSALQKVDLKVSDAEVSNRRVGRSTAGAIRVLQKKASLPETGQLDDKTLEALNAKLFNVYHTRNKTRTERLHSMLERLELPVARDERRNRIAGDSTRKAIEVFQKQTGLPVNGEMNEVVLDKLHEEVIKKRFSTRTQIGGLHRTLLQVGRIAKLPIEISPKELQEKTLGKTTAKAIKTLQARYKLPETGELDKATIDRLQSVAVSRGVRKVNLSAPEAKNLATVKKPLRLNMASPHVAEMQKALAHLGYPISRTEFQTKSYGKSTREAVLAFQKAKNLPQTGQVETGTLKELNRAIVHVNPVAAPSQVKYRIRGSVRDELLQRKGNMVIHVHERLVNGDSAQPLMTKKNHLNGFFDIAYAPPIDPLTGLVKKKFHLTVKLLNANDQLQDSQILYNVNRIQWVNFNQAGTPYRGDSEFAVFMKELRKALNLGSILDVKETAANQQVTLLSKQTSLSTDEIMRLILSHRVAAGINKPVLGPEVFYSFIRQNLPAALPGDLLAGTNDWQTIDQLIEIAGNGIAFTDDLLLDQTLELSLSQNLVSPAVKKNKAIILQALKDLRLAFTLNKPILIGNGNLHSLLERSSISSKHYAEVADVFVAARGINQDFWAKLSSKDSPVGEAEVLDFAATVELGGISKNHLPTVEFIRNNLGPTGDKKFKMTSDVAKLDEHGWVSLINENGSKVPNSMPGDKVADQVSAYAGMLRARAERAFPVVALVAGLKREGNQSLDRLTTIEGFVDNHPDFSFKVDNLDQYLLNNPAINLDAQSTEQIKVVQRVHKLAPDSATATALVAENLKGSAQIYGTGKDRFVNSLKRRNVEEKHALKVYERARMQYMQILARMLDFRREVHVGNPQVIIPQSFDRSEIINTARVRPGEVTRAPAPARREAAAPDIRETTEESHAAGDIPDLESLFGSMDYCECEECKSVYGPAAYFTDLLRFLKMHDSRIRRPDHRDQLKTVLEILFERRPDLGKIKLNCENTNTPLPYIDLVCEILENNVAPQQSGFSNQTTLTAAELRAMPQHIRPHAYDALAQANYPMNSSFNLWQEEARVYLGYLRAPRYELMEVFQDISQPSSKVPTDLSIAAEYFGISFHETALITNAAANSARQNIYWGFDTAVNTVNVKRFMRRTKLTYRELLDLLMVRFVNGAEPQSKVQGSCDLDEQIITHLSVGKFDAMHRFIRLWRKTGWEMWELDLLIRNPLVGRTQIDDTTLVNLKKFKQLAEKLSLSVEKLLAFYANVDKEKRIRADNPDVIIKPLYDRLFQNPAITNPVDSRFHPPLTPALSFDVESTLVPTILSALAISQSDFEILKSKTDLQLTEDNLATLLRYAYLARGLKLSIKDLWLLLGITNTSNPFSSLQATLDLIEQFDAIKNSSLSLLELDYVLNFDRDSSVGLRDETISRFIEALRAILLINQNVIAKLTLDDTRINRIANFSADSLAPMSDAQVLVAIRQLQSDLSSAREGFKSAAFAVEEAEYIIQFNPASGSLKTILIKRIKALQDDLKSLLNQNANQIVSHFASSFGLSDQHAGFLVTTLVVPGQTRRIAEIVSDPSLITPAGDLLPITEVNFPLHFKVYLLIHKISILIKQMNIAVDDLKFFQINHAALHTLDLAALPLAPFTTPNLFAEWLNLEKFLDFKSQYPEPEHTTLRDVLAKAKQVAPPESAAKLEIRGLLSKLTQWSADDLTALEAGLNLRQGSVTTTVVVLDYAKPDTYLRLQKCFAMIKLTGASVGTLFKWAARDNETISQQTAEQTRRAVKAKYESSDWLEKIKPLQDDLREKKRLALVAFHLDDSQRRHTRTVNDTDGTDIPNPLYWEDSNALFKYFLIDVEMTACQLTSRIKQAISSVQLFVQRCFLNLERRYVQVSQQERDDRASENAWSQWKWMKDYRIWEANRKVFLYPENWIEPELRDDKSPFFEELENEIMQSEITHDHAEAAFLNYLHKVDDVAHLEVCGVYHEMEDLNQHELGYELNFLHVVARTQALPPVYYYRKYDLNYSNWTAWEKIDVDIAGDHVTPVVYNRKLHLFWLVIIEKPQKVKKVPAAKPATTSTPQDSPEPSKILELQLAWTIQKEQGWTSKKISSQKVIHPWERPHHSYNLKPFYKPRVNELWLDVYLSTSQEFNDAWFFDPYMNETVKLTKNRFNETFLPWHSASFVFNETVTDVKLKGLVAPYHFYFRYRDSSTPVASNSFEYVHENFGEDGRRMKQFLPHEDGPRLGLPAGMHFRNTRLTNNVHDAVNDRELRVLEDGATTPLLRNAKSPFELVFTQQDLQLNTLRNDHPFFYQDNSRAFFIKPEWQQIFDDYGRLVTNTRRYHAFPFYHPYTSLFIRELNRAGLDGLLKRSIQTRPETFPPASNFAFASYGPADVVVQDETVRRDIVDFSFGGAYSVYNWEMFFHAPVMIATRLSQNQRFEEAMRWFHYVFDPTNTEALPTPQRFWVTKPFFEFNSEDYRAQRIRNILSNLGLQENKGQLIAWKNHPFNPHLIARYRPVAYQRNVVMKYLDNLIAWGDQLFRQDTIETINQASLLYMLAYEILGRRPEKVPELKRQDLTFDEIETKLDEFGNAKIDVLIENTLLPIDSAPSPTATEPLPSLDIFYFCLPNNDFLLKYWNTVEDRLFKIRHCMNIEGVVRQLPLFEPPIDPALLVKAAAAGIDLSSVLNDLSVGTPRYRFRVLAQKAVEFCAEVKALGEKLLNVLEKKDAEGLSVLRSQHEIQLLEAVKEIKKRQIDEAVETLGGLTKAKAIAEEKKSYYESREFINAFEAGAASLTGASIVLGQRVADSQLLIGILSALPSFSIGVAGFGGSPNLSVSWGFPNLAQFMQALNTGLDHLGAISTQKASLLGTHGGYVRRKEEWEFQKQLAKIEIDQMQFQMNAAEIRQAIAEKDLENQELQIDNARTVNEYMRNKYTNEQLFSWMTSQISTVYFQAYQLAYDMAKKAERAFQYELGITNSSFIQFGYWDSLRKGLLAGDKMMNDLRRLEAAYLDQNRRELEITKSISLEQVDPAKLLLLKETGECSLSLPEWLFDMDYPGHYLRRIKSVSISIPCIAGAYTSVNCTLSLIRNETRVDPTGTYAKLAGENETRFRTQLGAISSIATSHAQNDSGMFELNFNDERFLPFEGAGVISDWQIKMPPENNHFDFATISDVILHLKYTARDSGALAEQARANLLTVLPGATVKLISLKHQFSNDWYKFFNPVAGADQELIIQLRPELYPFFLRGRISTLKIKRIEVLIESKVVADFQLKMKVTSTADDTVVHNVSVGPATLYREYAADPKPTALGELRLKLRAAAPASPAGFRSLNQNQVDDVFLLCYIGP